MDIEYLINKYHCLIYKICLNMLSNSLEAEDTVQEVYLSVYKNFEKYKSLDENSLKNVICKIALNKCKDVLKSKAYKLERITQNDEKQLEKYSYDNDIESSIIKNDEKNYISKIINELKEPYKTIIRKYYIEEYTLDELSEELNINKATLKVQVYRGKKILKEKIMIVGGENFLL